MAVESTTQPENVSVAEAPFDLSQAHRWFAVEANNQSWSVLEGARRSAADIEEMIDAAHAAAWHWRRVGSTLNELRAQCLLTTAYGVAGRGEAASRHAEKSLKLSEALGAEQSEFDRACAHGAASLAFRIALRPREAAEQYSIASNAAKLLSERDEKEVFTRLYTMP
jgi:hypothetical protein